MPPLPDPVLAVWRFAPVGAGTVVVLPDGCRDLIRVVEAGGRARWMVSGLAERAEPVRCRPGERYLGFRLHPDARIDAPVLLAAVAALGEADEAAIAERLADFCRRDPRLAEALAGLADGASVAAAARALGITPRTLERLTGGATGRSPGFWKGLARARRAGRALTGPLPLAEIAHAHGYADQAHFGRALRRWFGAPPAALRRDPALLETLAAAGYG